LGSRPGRRVVECGARRGSPRAPDACEREGGSNSVVESQPSKLLVAGSIPVSRSTLRSLRERGWQANRPAVEGCGLQAGGCAVGEPAGRRTRERRGTPLTRETADSPAVAASGRSRERIRM
jgi:hypothetical protein